MSNNICDRCGAPLNNYGECEYCQTLYRYKVSPTEPTVEVQVKQRLTSDLLLIIAVLVCGVLVFYHFFGKILGMYTIPLTVEVFADTVRLLTGIYATLGYVEHSNLLMAWGFGIGSVLVAISLFILLVA